MSMEALSLPPAAHLQQTTTPQLIKRLQAGQAAGAAAPNDPTKFDADAQRAAQDFEAQFLSTYTEAMFAGIKTDGPFGGGHGEAVFRSMLVQEYGDAMAKSGGVGIADHVYREILQLQEANQ